MSLVHPLGRVLAAILLFVTFVHGQTCYYPGGLESGHTACVGSEGGKASACCGEEATCLGSGLCFSHGIMSRGSCTDKDWKDKACATVCTQGLLNFTAPITPCSDNGTSGVFACGLNSTACDRPSRTFTLPSDPSIVLRASEFSALASPAISSALAKASTATAAAVTITAAPSLASDPNLHTSAEMAGLAVGLAIPLLISLAFCFTLYRREQSRTPKLMYPLPDNMEDPYTMKDGRSLSPFPFARSPSTATSGRPPVSRDGSEISAITGMAKKELAPVNMHTFQDRYHLMKSKSGGLQVQRVELDASPEGNGEEFDDVEMGDVKVKPREHF